MLSRMLAASLCLILVGQPFAAELPTTPLEGGRVSPVGPVQLPALPVLPEAPSLAAPVQLTLPGFELPAAAASAQAAAAQAAAPTALAAARSISAAAASKEAQASPVAARDANDSAFDARRPEGSSAEPVAGFSSSGSAPLQPSGPVRGRWWKQWVPHAITGLNLASGTASMVFAVQGQPLLAAGLIVLAAVFDAFDGLAARKLRVAGPMGTMMDSQADGVSFGAAPALLAFSCALAPLAHGSLPLLATGFAAAAFSGFGAAYRLSRYNLDALAAGADKTPAPFFKGLPSPGGAISIAALVFAAPALPAALAFPVVAGGTAAIGLLMMSRLPYYKITSSWKAVVAAGLMAAKTGAVAALTGHVGLAPAMIVGGYLASAPLVALYRGGSALWKKELQRKAFHQSNLLFLGGFLALKKYADDHKTLAAFIGLTALIGFVEYCRLYGTRLRAFLEKAPPLKAGFAWLERLKREKEDRQPSGVFFGTLGATIAAGVAVFTGDWRYMAAAVLALALGDAASPMVGMRFGVGRYRVNGTLRSADGTLAGFAVALGIGLALGFPLAAALGAAVVFSLVDTYPVKPDDNLWIPASVPFALLAFGKLAAAFGAPAAYAAAALIAAAGAWLIWRASSKP